MDTKNLKHIAVIEMEDKASLIKTVNDAIDEYGLHVIHYNLYESVIVDEVNEYGTTVAEHNGFCMEIFYEGPVVFSYDFSGKDRKLNEFVSNGSKSISR